jgi:hypothetical protein
MITLSPRGRQRLAELRRTLGSNVAPYLAQLSDSERADLQRGLEVMRRLMTVELPDH